MVKVAPAGISKIGAVGDRHSQRAFIIEHTEVARTELVPEISLRLATETTSLWHATEAWLEEKGVPPPFWAFAWSGGQALARYVLDNPEIVLGKRVVDFGTGGGVVALAASRAGAREVVAVDCDQLALAACALNAEDNGLANVAPLFLPAGSELPASDVVLAGDVFYDRFEGPMVDSQLREMAARGTCTYVGCPGRIATPVGPRVVAEYDVPGVLELEGRAVQRARVLEIVPARMGGASGSARIV